VEADLGNGAARDLIVGKCLGDRLKKGVLVHAGFFVGTKNFYDRLKNMPEEESRLIRMREITYVNELYGDETLKVLQRADSRFVNSAMMATMMGGVVSDTLNDGQVVSGVGGQ